MQFSAHAQKRPPCSDKVGGGVCRTENKPEMELISFSPLFCSAENKRGFRPGGLLPLLLPRSTNTKITLFLGREAEWGGPLNASTLDGNPLLLPLSEQEQEECGWMRVGSLPPPCIERDDGPPAGFVFVQPGKRRGSEFLIPRLCVCYIAICLRVWRESGIHGASDWIECLAKKISLWDFPNYPCILFFSIDNLWRLK